ncbi:MAG: helix-turn-helix transcriptional regulator [Clostridia bacterium]|nr:helix-turn-helix transcriptional regulator [Clostridia bacterium]
METLRDLRLQAKKTCAEVAKVLGVANSSYYSYEQGVRRISLEQVLLLAKLYDCTEREIIQAQLNSCKVMK